MNLGRLAAQISSIKKLLTLILKIVPIKHSRHLHPPKR